MNCNLVDREGERGSERASRVLLMPLEHVI